MKFQVRYKEKKHFVGMVLVSLVFYVSILDCVFGKPMQEQFSIIFDLSESRREELHQLYQKMWWANTRTRSDVDSILEHSLAIGLIDTRNDTLIGFARIVSDHFKYAFVFDVLLEESYRGTGLGKVLMEAVLNHPALKRVTVFELHCLEDKAPFYKKFGFKEDFENLKALRLKRTV